MSSDYWLFLAFVGIQDRNIRGFKGIQLLRREPGEEVEFVTIMKFESLAAVGEFAGEDDEVLARFDQRSQHYEIIEERTGNNQEYFNDRYIISKRKFRDE